MMMLWVVRAAARRPAQARQQRKWSPAARLIVAAFIVAVAMQWPAGRIALAVIGGTIVFLVVAIVVWAFAKPAPRQSGPAAGRPVQQEGARR